MPLSRRQFLRLSATSATVAALAGCDRSPSIARKVHLVYWEKWTGDEGEAMRRVVESFNRAQSTIYVEYLNTSQIDRKLVVATAGGAPPDLCGVWSMTAPLLADHGAIVQLDPFIAREPDHKTWLDRYYPVLRDLVTHQGHVCALPTMHTVSGLFWNKALFRAAGLDPDQPPRTLAEFDDAHRRLTHRDPATQRLERLGWLSSEPGFFGWQYLGWHGGQIFDGRQLTLDSSPGNLAATRWIRHQTEAVGLDEFRRFSSGAAGASNNSFSSPQNPFFTGRVAMEFCGMWFANYIRRLAPGLDYGCAPWPEVVPGIADFCHAESDVIVIPRGTREPEAAWEFLRFLATHNPAASSPAELTGIESLARQMRRLSPLRAWSPAFAHEHPLPQVDVFRRLSDSPHAFTLPRYGIAQETIDETKVLLDKIRHLAAPPEAALAYAQQRLAASWSQHSASLARHRRA